MKNEIPSYEKRDKLIHEISDTLKNAHEKEYQDIETHYRQQLQTVLNQGEQFDSLWTSIQQETNRKKAAQPAVDRAPQQEPVVPQDGSSGRASTEPSQAATKEPDAAATAKEPPNKKLESQEGESKLPEAKSLQDKLYELEMDTTEDGQKKLENFIQKLQGDRVYQYKNGKKRYVQLRIGKNTDDGKWTAELVTINQDGSAQERKTYDDISKIKYRDWNRVPENKLPKNGDQIIYRSSADGRPVKATVAVQDDAYILRYTIDGKQYTTKFPKDKLRMYDNNGEAFACSQPPRPKPAATPPAAPASSAVAPAAPQTAPAESESVAPKNKEEPAEDKRTAPAAPPENQTLKQGMEKVLAIQDKDKQREALAKLIGQEVKKRTKQQKTDFPLAPAATSTAPGEIAAPETPNGLFNKLTGWMKKLVIGKFFKKHPEAAIGTGVGTVTLGAIVGIPVFTPVLIAGGLAVGAYGIFRYIRKINREGGGVATEEEPVKTPTQHKKRPAAATVTATTPVKQAAAPSGQAASSTQPSPAASATKKKKGGDEGTESTPNMDQKKAIRAEREKEEPEYGHLDLNAEGQLTLKSLQELHVQKVAYKGSDGHDYFGLLRSKNGRLLVGMLTGKEGQWVCVVDRKMKTLKGMKKVNDVWIRLAEEKSESKKRTEEAAPAKTTSTVEPTAAPTTQEGEKKEEKKEILKESTDKQTADYEEEKKEEWGTVPKKQLIGKKVRCMRGIIYGLRSRIIGEIGDLSIYDKDGKRTIVLQDCVVVDKSGKIKKKYKKQVKITIALPKTPKEPIMSPSSSSSVASTSSSEDEDEEEEDKGRESPPWGEDTIGARIPEEQKLLAGIKQNFGEGCIVKFDDGSLAKISYAEEYETDKKPIYLEFQNDFGESKESFSVRKFLKKGPKKGAKEEWDAREKTPEQLQEEAEQIKRLNAKDITEYLGNRETLERYARKNVRCNHNGKVYYGMLAGSAENTKESKLEIQEGNIIITGYQIDPKTGAAIGKSSTFHIPLGNL